MARLSMWQICVAQVRSERQLEELERDPRNVRVVSGDEEFLTY